MSLPRWLRNLGDITKAPMMPADVSRLDRMDGVTGEVPPEHVQRALAGPTEQQATRIMRDLFNCCPTCGWLPEGDGHVLTHHPSGAHYVTYGEDTRVHTVYDQETPLASEIEAWLAGGAK